MNSKVEDATLEFGPLFQQNFKYDQSQNEDTRCVITRCACVTLSFKSQY